MSLHVVYTQRDIPQGAGASHPLLGANGPAVRGLCSVWRCCARGRRRKGRQSC
jgi:hypothetical protein